MKNVISFEERKNKMIKEGQEMFEKAFDFKKLMDYRTKGNVSEEEIEEILQIRRIIDGMLPKLSKEERYEILKKWLNEKPGTI